MPFALALCGLALGDLRSARAEPAFAAGASEQYVADALVRSPSRSDHGTLDCVGRAAPACFTRPGGDSTLGMLECLNGELGYPACAPHAAGTHGVRYFRLDARWPALLMVIDEGQERPLVNPASITVRR